MLFNYQDFPEGFQLYQNYLLKERQLGVLEACRRVIRHNPLGNCAIINSALLRKAILNKAYQITNKWSICSMNEKNYNLNFGQKPTNPKFIDIEGQKFNRLLVLGFKESLPNSFQIWFCLCDCGNITTAESYKMRSGHTKSCGCFRKERGVMLAKQHIKHGKEGSRIYRVWVGILQRCFNPKTIGWVRYGGRGISVCDKWLQFEGFYEDMGEPPNDRMQIDRINNDGDYEKSNCRWATFKQQYNNKSNNRLVTYNGKTQSVTLWSEELGLDRMKVYQKLNQGLSFTEIVRLYGK